MGDLIEADQLARGEVQLDRRSTEIDTLLRRVVRDFPHQGRRIDVAVNIATIQVDPARLQFGSSAVRAFLPTAWTPSSEPATPVGGSDDFEAAASDEAVTLGRRLSSTR